MPVGGVNPTWPTWQTGVFTVSLLVVLACDNAKGLRGLLSLGVGGIESFDFLA